jgi:hypothetical protein
LIFLLLAFTNSGVKYALIPDKKTVFHNVSIAVFALCLVFAFFTAGYEKAFVWLDFDLSTSGINYWFYGGYFTQFRTRFLADYFLQVPSLVKEFMDYTAVFFELSGIFFLLYNKKTWLLYLLLAAFFHLSNTLILNISFLSHFTVYGIWLLSPVLIRNKWYFFILIIPLFFSGLILPVILWSSLLIVVFFYWRKGLYIQQENSLKTVINEELSG